MKIIVAKDLRGAIGKNNQLPWKLSWDLKNFKSLTMGGTVLMGRKTFESIGKPLPGRRNLVITRDKTLQIQGVEIVYSLEQALAIDPELFVMGGEEVYRMALPYARELHLTVVQTIIKDADAFFPNEDLFDWLTIRCDTYHKDDRNEFDSTYYHMIKQ